LGDRWLTEIAVETGCPVARTVEDGPPGVSLRTRFAKVLAIQSTPPWIG